MNITITARKTTVKDSFKEKVEKKLSKFDRFFDDAKASVTVTNEKNRETVEVTIRSKSLIFRAEKTTEDRSESLDCVVDLLFKQIVKNKSKLEDKMKSSAFDGLEACDSDNSEEAYNIVKHKKFPVSPMSVEEAVLQMNMLGHQFFMFESSETGEINVVYHRNNGDYGLLEPVK